VVTQSSDQATKLIARIKKLSTRIASIRSDLRSVKDHEERYVAVIATGRMINVLTSHFEFNASLEANRDSMLNTRIVRVASNDESAVRELAAIEDELLESMLNHLDQRVERAKRDSR
jgi:iron-sulfur cluster repair protein YtfE (RIC family)